ncbi:MAG TPA: FtsX-like permease family protein [Kiritimatiellia bacterium]|nr:FtsX-like permease family protein [Kiritimatiellia bacterium]
MKVIDVQPQPLLGFAKTLRIALSGVKYRLFRAMVTVAVISVAMAFLMNILAESLIKKTVAETAQEQIENMRRVDRWIARLSIPQTAGEIIEQAAVSETDSDAIANLQALGRLSEPETEALRTLSLDARKYLAFFEDIDYGRRRVLVGSAETTLIFDRLQEPSARDVFYQRLGDMRTIRFISEPEAFNTFLDNWPILRALIDRIRSGQSIAIQSIQQQMAGRNLMESLRFADGAFGDTIRNAGFSLSAEEGRLLAEQVGDVADSSLIEDAVNHADVRQAVAARRDIMPGDVTPALVWDMLKREDHAEWYLARMMEAGYPVSDWNSAIIIERAASRAHAFLLKQAERATVETGGGLMGIGERMTWLAFVSMLVCAVGIANAMLMSVTERFREIATLKCLGALDGFIMTVFLIEASILGLVGGIAGTLIGLIIAILRMLAVFKGLLFDALPLGSLFTASLLSIAVGVILAAVSAVYPSFRAARLAPMEAMRIE